MKIMEKRPFFRATMAGLGKYHTAGFGWIGVYRVNIRHHGSRVRFGNSKSRRLWVGLLLYM